MEYRPTLLPDEADIVSLELKPIAWLQIPDQRGFVDSHHLYIWQESIEAAPSIRKIKNYF